MADNRAWGDSWGDAWGDSWGENSTGAAVDGGRVRRRRRQAQPVKPIDLYRTPEDIRREQLETESYLASLEQQTRRPSEEPVRSGESQEAPTRRTVATAPSILAGVAARAASAVQAKIEEAESAAALGMLAEQQKRRHMLVLLLALD